MSELKYTGYDLSRAFFNWSFENPEKVNPNHIALYFFCIEHCNRLGWKKKFGLPTTMAKEAIGIKSYNTFIKTLNDLIEYGFILIIERSKNQYSSNIIALSKNDKAPDKALDKATVKHVTKQGESTVQSIDSILKQVTNNQEQYKKKPKLLLAREFYTEECLKAEKEQCYQYYKLVHLMFDKENDNANPFELLTAIPKQLTFTQYKKLKEKYGENKITEVIMRLENYKKKSDYTNLYLTLNNWLNK